MYAIATGIYSVLDLRYDFYEWRSLKKANYKKRGKKLKDDFKKSTLKVDFADYLVHAITTGNKNVPSACYSYCRLRMYLVHALYTVKNAVQNFLEACFNI